MNKKQFVKLVSEKHSIKRDEANKIIDIFTSSVIEALSKDGGLALIGFGIFSVSDIPARDGRNPATGAPIKIPAYRQPRFRAGINLKKAVNN